MILEARGVPLDYRSGMDLGDMVRPLGMLRQILSDVIKAEDPNIVLYWIGLTGCPPLVTRISGHKGISDVHMVMHSLPLPPPSQSIHPYRGTRSTEGLERDRGRTRLARLTEE